MTRASRQSLRHSQSLPASAKLSGTPREFAMADQLPAAPAAWTIAGVQMDVRLGDSAHNLAAIRTRLRTAADRGARLVLFPECALAGYGFNSKADALRHAEPLPGPSIDALADDCRRLGVW